MEDVQCVKGCEYRDANTGMRIQGWGIFYILFSFQVMHPFLRATILIPQKNSVKTHFGEKRDAGHVGEGQKDFPKYSCQGA